MIAFTEDWKPAGSEFPGYEVSRYGTVRNQRTQRPLTPFIREKRLHVVLYSHDGRKVIRTVARLVLEAFVGQRPDGHEVQHVNGDKSDCRLQNLRWVERSANRARGEAAGRSKLTAAQVKEARRRYAEGGISIAGLARKYAVSRQAMRAAINGRTWKNAGGPIAQ